MARTWGSFFWPDSDVLKNKLGIQDGEQLSEAEYDITELRMQQLLADPNLITAATPVERIQQIHAHLFGDVYDWAGELRTFSLRKNDSVFADPYQIPDMLRHGDAQLRAATWSSRRKAVNGIADAFGWLNYTHPFREGNGRATRTSLRLALREHGLDLDVSAVDKRRWTVASIMSAPRENWLRGITVSPGAMKPLLRDMIQPAQPIRQIDEATILRLVENHRAQPEPAPAPAVEPVVMQGPTRAAQPRPVTPRLPPMAAAELHTQDISGSYEPEL